jgi:uncharacterized membrane protein
MTLLLILHIAAFAMGTGVSFSNLMNARLAAGLEGEGFKTLGRLRMQLARVGDVLIATIWLTGLLLLWLRGGLGPGAEAWFYLKLAAAVLLTASHGLARATAGRMIRSGDRGLLPRLTQAIAGVWVSALAAILLAVLAFSS